MATTSEFTTGKSILILAVVVGCFAILWPKVFFPMMQAAFYANKPTSSGATSAIDAGDQGEQLNDKMIMMIGNSAYKCNPVCCDVIYENNIDLKFFAELCKSVIEREMATDAGIRKHRREKYPPPGMMERCRRKILELCDIDISEALTETKRGKISIDTRNLNNSNETESKPQLNLTECLEKHFHLKGPTPRRISKETTLPSHIRQERPPHAGPEVLHPALKERGNPFPTLERGKPALITTIKGKPGPMSSLRPPMGGGGGPGKTGSGKGPGAMSLLMPIYTVGIVVFFLYTISKVLLRKPNEETTKVLDFHRDPEYRKYINNHDYSTGQPLTYKEYLRKKEEEDVKRTAKLLGDAGRKQVFTAIEGIIAEMDEYRERIMADQTMKTVTGEDDVEGHQIANGIASDVVRITEGPENLEEEILVKKVEPEEKITKEKLEDELARISALATDDTKIAVLGMETQVEFTEKPEKHNVDEVSNIVLETSVPSDTQLFVAESQSLTHTTTEHIDGWSDMEEQPVIVTGKMTISLLGKEASVHFTESKTSRDHEIANKSKESPISNATVNHANSSKEGKIDNITLQRRQIEELANALVDDILHNQVPKIFDRSNVSTPEVDDTFDTTSPFETRPRVPPRKQYSRESLNSQGSSFEYLSACQEVDFPQTPIAEESPTSTGFNLVANREKTDDDYDNTNHVRNNGRSSSNLNSFECVSIGSVSPLSPETEGTYEKVFPHSTNNGCENGSLHQPTNYNSQDSHYTENSQRGIQVNNGQSDFKINHKSNGDTRDSVSTLSLESERLTADPSSESTSRIQADVDDEQKSAEEEEDSRDTTPEADDVKRFA